jgi:hypothetical protein
MTLDQLDNLCKLAGQISLKPSRGTVRIRKYAEWNEKERDMELKMTKGVGEFESRISSPLLGIATLSPSSLHWGGGGGGYGYYNLAPWQPEDNQ